MNENKNLSHLEEWKQWFNKWKIRYSEQKNANEITLLLEDCNECFSDVVFDLSENFVCIDCGHERN